MYRVVCYLLCLFFLFDGSRSSCDALVDVGLGLFFDFGVCLILIAVGIRCLFCLVCWGVFLCC